MIAMNVSSASDLDLMQQCACLVGVVQILIIAVLMRWVLKRKFSLYQWEALVLLMAGITVNQLNNCGYEAHLLLICLYPAHVYA